MQSETGFPSSHQLKSYVASKSRLKLAARAVLSADAGLLVKIWGYFNCRIETEGFFKVAGTHIHCKIGNISETVQDRDVVTRDD